MTERVQRLRSSWRWLLALYTIAGFVETAFFGQVGSFMPLYLPRLGVPPDQVRAWAGWIVAIGGVVGIPLLPLWGALADRYARKPVIIRSFVAEMLAALMMAAAPGLGLFVLGRAITSFALGNSGLMMTTLAERTPSDRVGLAFSIFNGAPAVGLFIGPLLGGVLFDRFGYQVLLVANAVILAAISLLLALGYEDDYRPASPDPVLRMARESVQIIWQTLSLRTLFPALFLLFAGRALASSYIPLAIAALYRGDSLGAAVGLASAAGGVAALVLSPIFGAIADRRGHWRVLLAGAGLTVILWPLPGLLRDLTGFVAAWAFLSGVSSGVQSISFSVLSASAPARARARVMSFSYLPVVAGFTIGPAVGALATRDSVFAVFPAAALVAAAGLAALAYAGRYQPRVVPGVTLPTYTK